MTSYEKHTASNWCWSCGDCVCRKYTPNLKLPSSQLRLPRSQCLPLFSPNCSPCLPRQWGLCTMESSLKGRRSTMPNCPSRGLVMTSSPSSERISYSSVLKSSRMCWGKCSRVWQCTLQQEDLDLFMRKQLLLHMMTQNYRDDCPLLSGVRLISLWYQPERFRRSKEFDQEHKNNRDESGRKNRGSNLNQKEGRVLWASLSRLSPILESRR